MERSERILVVEDDHDLCSLLSNLLGFEGYATATASDGSEAVQRVLAERPDAVVLDVMLPGRSGFDICRDLKFRRETNLIPIVMLTAMSGEEARTSGLRVGANRYITKPFEPDALLRELRDALDHRRELEDGRTHTAVEIQMNSDTRHREQLNDLLSELFLLTPLSEEDVGRIRYAVLEMIENAMEWGNRRRKDLLAEATERDLEGVVAKHLGSPYQPGKRTPNWRKVKIRREVEVVVGGYTGGTGTRASSFGALLVGVPETDGSLKFAGGVGTGYTQRTLDELLALLRPLRVDACPFDPTPPREYTRNATWVEPVLIARIQLTEFTNEGYVRQSSFIDLVEPS